MKHNKTQVEIEQIRECVAWIRDNHGNHALAEALHDAMLRPPTDHELALEIVTQPKAANGFFITPAELFTIRVALEERHS